MSELELSFEKMPDYRSSENTHYEIRDAAMSAFGIFFTQSNSFLAYQRMVEERKDKSNVQSLFRAERIPSDNQIRNLLDFQELELVYGVFRIAVTRNLHLTQVDEAGIISLRHYPLDRSK